jgi:hypothetical protein
MPLCTLGDPLPYIYLVHIKTTTFVIENNVSPLKVPNKYRETTKPSLIEQKWYIIWRVPSFVCLFFFRWGYVEPPKLHVHEGLTHLFTKAENFTQSTRDHCTVFTNWRQTTLYDNVQMYMYLRGGSRHFHKGSPFYFRNHFFLL